ncbi:MAG TPA: hypothetical protein VK518_03545 [Puia sp.]|nr:hypothetical protein [Puia sp.]
MQKTLIWSGYFFPGQGINHETIQLTQKQSQMKKFLVVLAIGAFAACNNSGGSEASKDSTVVKDSVTKMTDSTKMTTDSTKMATDTTKKDTATKK